MVDVVIRFTADEEMLNKSIDKSDNEVQRLSTDIEQKKSQIAQLRTELSAISSAISAISGMISLVYAITGEQQDQMITGVISIAMATLSQVQILMATAAATGNFPLFLAMGSLAASTASSINTIRAISNRNQMNYEATRKRNMQRLIK